MSGLVGASVEQLDKLAARLDLQSAKFREIAGSSTAAIMTAQWTGANIDRVRGEWNRTSRPALLRLADDLRRTAGDIRQQAEQQRQASQGGTGAGGAARPGSASQAGTPEEQIAKLWEWLGKIAPTAVTATGMLVEGTDLMALLSKLGGATGGLNSLSDIVGDLKGLKAGSLLSLVSMGFSANDLGVALGEGNDPEAYAAAFDLIAGGAGFIIPGAGLAWEGGKLIGETLYGAVEPFWSLHDAAYDSAVEDLFGPNADPNNLTQEQADIMVKRYDGPFGICNSISDDMRGAGKALGDVAVGAGKAVGDGINAVGTAVGNKIADWMGL